MTYEEARRVADVICTADSGCSYCVGALVEKLNTCGLGWAFAVEEDAVECAAIVGARSCEIPRHYPAVAVRPAATGAAE